MLDFLPELLNTLAWYAAWLVYIRCYCCAVGSRCDQCAGGTAPDSYQVDITAFTNNSCTVCESDFNGTHVLVRARDCTDDPFTPPASFAGTCIWHKITDNSCTYGVGSLVKHLCLRLAASGADMTVQVAFVGTFAAEDVVLWANAAIAEPNCTFSALEVVYSSTTIAGVCTNDGSSVFVTAL
jgi:hypothetical protein